MFGIGTTRLNQNIKQSPEDLCKSTIQIFKSKANHNKNESMFCFWASMGGALVAPLFVTLGADIAMILGKFGSVFVLSKLIPTLLSIGVAFSTAWLQLRKPQQLWALYRTTQRKLEDNLYKWRYNILEYENHPNAEGFLVENVSKIALEAHYAWLPIVPNPEDSNKVMSSKSKESK